MQSTTMAIIDSLQMDKDLREILKTKCYYEILQYTHKELPDSLISKFKKGSYESFFAIIYLIITEKYDKIVMSHQTSGKPDAKCPSGRNNGRRTVIPQNH